MSVAGGTERTLRACSQRASCEEDGGRRAGGAGNGCVADAEAGGDEHAGVQVGSPLGSFHSKECGFPLGAFVFLPLCCEIVILSLFF